MTTMMNDYYFYGCLLLLVFGLFGAGLAFLLFLLSMFYNCERNVYDVDDDYCEYRPFAFITDTFFSLLWSTALFCGIVREVGEAEVNE